jgi:hypothetical protein
MPIRKFLKHNAFNPETILEPRPGRPSFPITCPASAAHLMAESEGPLWVMSGNARSDDIESAFHPKTDIARRGWKVRSGPTHDIPGRPVRCRKDGAAHHSRLQATLSSRRSECLRQNDKPLSIVRRIIDCPPA